MTQDGLLGAAGGLGLGLGRGCSANASFLDGDHGLEGMQKGVKHLCPQELGYC